MNQCRVPGHFCSSMPNVTGLKLILLRSRPLSHLRRSQKAGKTHLELDFESRLGSQLLGMFYHRLLDIILDSKSLSMSEPFRLAKGYHWEICIRFLDQFRSSYLPERQHITAMLVSESDSIAGSPFSFAPKAAATWSPPRPTSSNDQGQTSSSIYLGLHFLSLSILVQMWSWV